MSGTKSSMRSCTILQILGGYDECYTNVMFKREQMDEFSAQALPAYFYERSEEDRGKSDACCWNVTHVATWFYNIGTVVNQQRAFTAYRDMVRKATTVQIDNTGKKQTVPLWNGMRIIDKAVLHHGIDATDQLSVPLRKHRDLIFFYARVMYTSHQAQLCPGGQLCLVAVNTAEVGGALSSRPQPCPKGSYCLTASDQILGTGLCPIGYYCPERTVYPKPSEPGYFTENFGAVE